VISKKKLAFCEKKKNPTMFSRTPGVFFDIARILLVPCLNAKNQRDKTKALYKKQQESLIKHIVANHKSKKMVWASLLLAGEEDWHCARNRREVPFPELSYPIYTRFKSGVPLLSSLQDHYRFLVSPFTYIPSNSKGQPFIVNTLGSFLLLMRSLMLRFHYQTTKNRRGGNHWRLWNTKFSSIVFLCSYRTSEMRECFLIGVYLGYSLIRTN